MKRKLSEYIKSGLSMVSAINRACSDLCDGDTLLLGGGRLDIFAEGAFEKHYYMSNNDAGVKPIAFPLIEKRNIIIDGEGADLVFHGGILPFAVDASVHVTIRNLSVDYAEPMFSQARIAESEKGRLVLQFDGEEFCCKVRDNRLVYYSAGSEAEVEKDCALCLEFEESAKAPSAYLKSYFYYSGEKKDHGFLRDMFRDVTLAEVGKNRIEIRGDLGLVHTPGNMWVCTYAGRHYCGFLLHESKDVCIENVALYQTQGMGVLCQLSENITLDRVKARIRPGSKRLLTTGADATHFVNCRGKIRILDCIFVNMMDDACNIHGIYLKEPRRETEHSFIASYGHNQQVGINIFRPGDRVNIIDTENLDVLVSAEVLESRLLDENTLQVVTRESIPFLPEGCVAENMSTAPQIHISGTESGHNRPRGFLLSSAGKTLVEHCKFYNMSHGISIGGEMLDWYESGAVTDVTIRNNEFCNSAYAEGVAIYIMPRIRHRESIGSFHGRICIENNHFTMHEPRLLNASNVKELYFMGNTFTCDPTLPSHPMESESGVVAEYCEKYIS